MPVFVQQPAIALGFVQRREILTLQVLDEGDLERLPVGILPDDHRQFVKLGQLRARQRRSPAMISKPFGCSGSRRTRIGCRYALLGDRLASSQILLANLPARLKPARPQMFDRHVRAASLPVRSRRTRRRLRRAAPKGPDPMRAVSGPTTSGDLPLASQHLARQMQVGLRARAARSRRSAPAAHAKAPRRRGRFAE